MNKQLSRIVRNYSSSLRKFVEQPEEAGLAGAYELGRRAISKGLGILDMARIHQEALKGLMHNSEGLNGYDEKPPTRARLKRGSGQQLGLPGPTRELFDDIQPPRSLKPAEAFLLEALSPFEATHRGFRDLTDRLQQRNRDLENEISERRRVERALRESELHYQRLFKEAKAMQENLRELSNEILRTQEDERARISRELHDEIGQSLTAISVTLTTLKHQGAWNSRASIEQLVNAQKLLKETMLTVHRFARDLRPAMLEELGLLQALRAYLKSFAARTGLQTRLDAQPAAERLPSETKMVLFRIIQESLTNVIKHARARKVEVALSEQQEGICLEIRDDGRSFKAKPKKHSRSQGRLGFLGMQERVRLINGQFTARARPGKGTTVRVLIPLNTGMV
jgi:signal transduction histidine kinase